MLNIFSRFLPLEGLFFVVHVLAAHFAVQLLAAAEADEGDNNFNVQISWKGGFVPFAAWISSSN